MLNPSLRKTKARQENRYDAKSPHVTMLSKPESGKMMLISLEDLLGNPNPEPMLEITGNKTLADCQFRFRLAERDLELDGTHGL
jgi:hypothetical protein